MTLIIFLLQPALDALLTGEFRETLDDVFYSDDEEDFVKRAKVPQSSAKDVKMKLVDLLYVMALKFS